MMDGGRLGLGPRSSRSGWGLRLTSPRDCNRHIRDEMDTIRENGHFPNRNEWWTLLPNTWVWKTIERVE